MVDFFKPRFIIENVSNKRINIIGFTQIEIGETVDLFKEVNPVNTLLEDHIIKGLEKPWGDLYIESEITRNIVIKEICLTSWNYSRVRPVNLTASNTPQSGYVPSYEDDGTFSWIPSGSFSGSVNPPLQVTGDGTIFIPLADSSTDGYLSSTDFARFDAGLKKQQKIWQYQDFTAPVNTNLTLSAFENGTGLLFNATYIIDDEAVATLVSNTSKPPTNSVTFPINLLPSNRVIVSSQTGTTVVLNQAPHTSLNIRVFYLISVPAGVSMPVNYQEDPEFTNDTSLDYLDDLYVNQNADESIYGIKTFEGSVIFNSTFQLTTSPTSGYFLQSDASGNASWQPIPSSGGGSGLFQEVSNIVTLIADGYRLRADEIEFNDGDGYINRDGSGELQFTDLINGTQLLSNLVNTNAVLNDLTDVNTISTAPSFGSILEFDGYLWTVAEGVDVKYNREIDEITGGDLYIGEALPGTLTSEAKWRIQFIEFIKTGPLEDVSTKWAGGNSNFDKIFDDRLSYIYS